MTVMGGAFAMSLLGGSAFADRPEPFVIVGTSHGEDARRLSTFADDCRGCPKAASGAVGGERFEPPAMAMIAVGLAGSERRIRGGVELNTVLEVGPYTAGYTALLTYGGIERGRLFGMVGLGLGTYWGGDRLGLLGSIAGTSTAELGVRLTRHVRVVVRGDVIANSGSVNPLATLGLQFFPGHRF